MRPLNRRRGTPPGAAGCIAPGAWRRQPPHTRPEMSITTSCSRIPIRSIPLFHAEDIRRDSAHSPRNNDPHGCSHRTAAGAPFRGRRGEWPLQGYSVQSIPSPPCSKEARYNQLFFHYGHAESRNTRTSLEKFLFEQPDMTLTDKPIYTRETVGGGI